MKIIEAIKKKIASRRERKAKENEREFDRIFNKLYPESALFAKAIVIVQLDGKAYWGIPGNGIIAEGSVSSCGLGPFKEDPLASYIPHHIMSKEEGERFLERIRLSIGYPLQDSQEDFSPDRNNDQSQP